MSRLNNAVVSRWSRGNEKQFVVTQCACLRKKLKLPFIEVYGLMDEIKTVFFSASFTKQNQFDADFIVSLFTTKYCFMCADESHKNRMWVNSMNIRRERKILKTFIFVRASKKHKVMNRKVNKMMMVM